MTVPSDIDAIVARRVAARAAVLARRTLWLTAERVVFSTGLLAAAMFGWFHDMYGTYGLWTFLFPPDGNGITRWVGLWTIATLLLVLAALATPGGMMGSKRHWVTVAALGLLTAAHLVVLALYAIMQCSFHAAYVALIALAAASTCVWWPREDIDEVD